MTATLVFGLGVTGLSCVRHLIARGVATAVFDTREEPPGLQQLCREQPDVAILPTTELSARLGDFDRLIVSPGIPLEHCVVREARAKGLTIGSDISLFVDAVAESAAPIVGITGTNGKSTVAMLVGHLLGERAAVGGNIGVAALQLLEAPRERYVLELSSFQLERLDAAHFDVATVLNVTPDHLDRYDSFDAYVAAKRRIYDDCRFAVYDGRDSNTVPPAAVPGIDVSASSDWRLDADSLVLDGRIVALGEFRLRGRHNARNLLIAAAVAHASGVAIDDVIARARTFVGLEHRCEWVAEIDGVDFINDSKATNVGAALAALEGLGDPSRRRVVLIAGGDGKGADFRELAAPARQYVRHAILIGRDGPELAQTFEPVGVPTAFSASMVEAVRAAAAAAQSGDVVLLSPACASFDMFDNFEARGRAFCDAVHALGGRND